MSQVLLEDSKVAKNKRKVAVVQATCTCTIGLGGHCTHVAVLLAALSTRVTKTSLPTSWFNPDRPWQEEDVASIPELLGVPTAIDSKLRNCFTEEHFQIFDAAGAAAPGYPPVKFILPCVRVAAMEQRKFIVDMSVQERLKAYTQVRTSSGDAADSLPSLREALALTPEQIDRVEELTCSNAMGRRNFFINRHGRCNASIMGKVKSYVFLFFLSLSLRDKQVQSSTLLAASDGCTFC